jgi:1-acyl-sn-glycerol-3-phosphate acyltransferase
MSKIALQRTNIRTLSDAEIQQLIEKNKDIYTEFYDAAYVESVSSNIFAHLDPVYFRPEFVGFDEPPTPMPNNKPLIYAGNHSGMAFPWDAMVFGAEMYLKINKRHGQNSLRPLTAPMLSETYLMNPYMIPFMWKRVGGIDATSLNFETLMYFNEADVLVYPEGVPGIGKGFNRRYQLQRFSSSFIRMSLKHRTDIIPVAAINGEFINPYSYRSKFMNAIVQKIGIPYLPIGILTLLLFFQPWIFYFGLPAKLIYVRGKRIKPYEMTDKAFDDLDMDDLRIVTEQVRAKMQEHLTASAQQYGQQPYDWKSLFRAQRGQGKRFWFHYPMFWQFIFWEHERQYRRFQQDGTPVNMDFGFGGFLKMLFRHAFLLFYFLPIIGWIPLLFKGYTRQGDFKV